MIKESVSFERVEQTADTSFSVVAYANPFFAAPLHIHPEYELILIEEGDGLSFVGDSVRKLAPGDFMLIGKELPHLWLSADIYYEKDSSLVSRSVYAQFKDTLFPQEMCVMPELKEINRLLEVSQRGILFGGRNLEDMKAAFRLLTGAHGFWKWRGMMDLLYRLSTECQVVKLSSEQYARDCLCRDDRIIRKAHEYMNRHYQDNVALSDIADYSGMNASALCRYYKRHTGRTLFTYLSELRISYAAKLLMNRSFTVGQVAYACGYNSLSHFNRQFKTIVGLTPSEYIGKLRHESV